MKRAIHLFFLFLSITINFTYAQNEEDWFINPETQATVEGGMGEFYRYLAKHLTLSKEVIEKDYDTKIYISFYVETNGIISEIELVKGNNPELFEKAKELFLSCNDPESEIPKWIPGKIYDEPVRSKMFFPIQVELR